MFHRRRHDIISMEEGIVYGAHMRVSSDDPADALQILDAYPNLIVDTTAYEPVLGQDPERARPFFIQYQDRILFGTDGVLERIGTLQRIRKGTDRESTAQVIHGWEGGGTTTDWDTTAGQERNESDWAYAARGMPGWQMGGTTTDWERNGLGEHGAGDPRLAGGGRQQVDASDLTPLGWRSGVDLFGLTQPSGCVRVDASRWARAKEMRRRWHR